MTLTTAMAFVIATVPLLQVAQGTVYKVGDAAGWTVGQVNYQPWAASKQFHVGDVVVFVYDAKEHNVMQVSHEDYRNCNAAAPITTYTSGNDSITISKPQHYFFICGIPGHCQGGQKVDINALNKNIQAVRTLTPAPAPGPAHHRGGVNKPNVNLAGIIMMAFVVSFGTLHY